MIDVDGRLIAIDGAHGPDVSAAATLLQHALTARDVSCALSKWDASGLFTDVVAAPEAIRDVSPRTLILLYAADLAFRIRWEIAPALDQGVIVVAAPYVTTAISFGLANGFSSHWLRTIFRFAPEATRTVILGEQKSTRTWKRKPQRGFCECCTALLKATPEGFARKKTRAAMLASLSTSAHKQSGLARKRDVRKLAARLAEEHEQRTSGRKRR
jgi:thymidylate kinase